MNVEFDKLPASALRTIVILEIRKFIEALELRAELGVLQKMRDHIKKLMELLSIKEIEETRMLGMNDLPFPNEGHVYRPQ
jgi:hypothetical protein